MCFLKIYSDKQSFKEFALATRIPVYSVFDKGEFRSKRAKKPIEQYVISLDVSKKDWDEFKLQVQDAIEFLSSHTEELKKLIQTHDITDAYLDFLNRPGFTGDSRV